MKTEWQLGVIIKSETPITANQARRILQEICKTGRYKGEQFDVTVTSTEISKG